MVKKKDIHVEGFPSRGRAKRCPVHSGRFISLKAPGFNDDAKGITPKGRRFASNRSPSLRGQNYLAALPLIGFGAEGFEPPTYWSQTSRASQTALYPDK